MAFADIIGHKRVVQILKRATRRGRVHHAYLFAGPDGIGKERVAFELFKLLNCKAPRRPSPVGTHGDVAQDDACDACTACRKLDRDAETSRGEAADEEQAYTFADLIVLRPQGAFIKIAGVRGMMRRIAYAPVEGRVKTVLIRDAHKLHETAANAVLKTLEEPPADTVFVLVSSAPHLLLPTIVSRCQLVRFSALSRAEVERYLREQAEVPEVDAGPVAAMGDGSIGRALELLRNPVVQRRGDFLAEMGALAGGPDHAVFSASESLATDRQQLPLYLDVLRSWFRDQLLAREGVPADAMTNIDLTTEVRNAAAGTDRRTLLERLHRIDTAERALNGNANAQLTMDWLLLHLFRSQNTS